VLAPKLDTHNRFAVLGAPDYEEEDEDEAKYQDKAELQEQDAGKEGARLGDLEIPEVPRKQAAEVDTALKVHLALSLSPRFSLAVSLSHTRPSLSLPLDVYRLMSRVLSLARSLACSRKLSLLSLSLSLSLSLLILSLPHSPSLSIFSFSLSLVRFLSLSYSLVISRDFCVSPFFSRSLATYH
jgi:hypothetical protein